MRCFAFCFVVIIYLILEIELWRKRKPSNFDKNSMMAKTSLDILTFQSAPPADEQKRINMDVPGWWMPLTAKPNGWRDAPIHHQGLAGGAFVATRGLSCRDRAPKVSQP